MKQAADKYTGELFEKPKRGRPRTPNATTPAQRTREYRQRRKFNFLIPVTPGDKSA